MKVLNSFSFFFPLILYLRMCKLFAQVCCIVWYFPYKMNFFEVKGRIPFSLPLGLVGIVNKFIRILTCLCVPFNYHKYEFRTQMQTVLSIKNLDHRDSITNIAQILLLET